VKCDHSPAITWADEQSAWEVAANVERRTGVPISVQQCPECQRWELRSAWRKA